MKLDKKKIVFGIVILLVLVFMVVYAMLFLTDGGDAGALLDQPLVPALETAQKEYASKLEALDDLKEVKTTNAPSIYDEKYLDTTGVFDPDLIDAEKAKMVDSIYRLGRIDYTQGSYRKSLVENKGKVHVSNKKKAQENIPEPKEGTKRTLPEMAMDHQLFFASAPRSDVEDWNGLVVPAVVHRTQTVRANDRLDFRLLEKVVIDGKVVSEGTILFGIVGFRPNRMVLDIGNIDHIPLKVKAYDYRDGREGLYIQNTFRAELSSELMEDVVEDINVPGVPQVKGLKNIFKRSNRQVRATVNKNYKILLKLNP
ncbi:conjugative transposon protein TraM [Muricauda sp. NFXS6]|uniref:conjugative transposon protein TraM n=1 Tax=Allomuricauda sp. NFXS6 TaxID=2819094 RepID=UPI0032DECC56